MAKLAANEHEKRHMGILKGRPCALCQLGGKTEVHHIINGYRLGHLFTLPLCSICHEHIKDKTDENNLIRQLVARKQLYSELNLDCPPYISKIPYINRLMAEAGL